MTRGDAVADVGDLGPLAWVLEETRRSIEASAKALKRFARETESARGVELSNVDAGQLRVARQQIHQVVGALEMIGQSVAARMVRGMEGAVQQFVLHPEKCSESAALTLERAGFALIEYLESQLGDHPRPALGLFPQFLQVQQMAGADRVHPADLWNVTWRWAEPAGPAAGQSVSYGLGVRTQLDQRVLKIMRDGELTSASELSFICLALAGGESARQPAIFWRLAAGFFEAIGKSLISLDAYTRRAVSRVLLQYTSLARGEPAVSDRLALDLLFFCAQAQPRANEPAPMLEAVRKAWALDTHESVAYEEPMFGLFDPSVLAQARRRVEAVKENWSALAGGDMARLKSCVDQFGLAAESLVKLHHRGKPLADALTQVAAHTAQSNQPPSPELAMETATAILFLEASFSDFQPADPQFTSRILALADRLTVVTLGGRPQALEPWMEELYRGFSERQTMGTVIGELRVTLGEAEQHLDRFFRQPADLTTLDAVPGLMSQMRGVLSVLGLEQAALAVGHMRTTIESLLTGQISVDQARNDGTFERFGNSLGALGFLIDMLAYQPVLAKKLFAYDSSTGELCPLMERTPGDPVSVGPVGPAAWTVDMGGLDFDIGSDIDPLSPDEFQDATKPGPLVPVEDAPIQSLLAPLEQLAITAALDEKPALAQAATQAAEAVREQDEEALSGALAHLDTISRPAEPVRDAEPPSARWDDEDDEGDLLDIFLEEAREVVLAGTNALGELGVAPADMVQQTILRRAFHTLKGSSRMVGLTQFGDAAWSMEQLLNSWLAEYKPVTQDLREFAGEALQALGRWVEDIAAKNDEHWEAAPFSLAADAMRTEGQRLPLLIDAGSEESAQVPEQDGEKGEEGGVLVLDLSVEPEEPSSAADEPAGQSESLASATEDVTGSSVEFISPEEPSDLLDLDLEAFEQAPREFVEAASFESVQDAEMSAVAPSEATMLDFLDLPSLELETPSQPDQSAAGSHAEDALLADDLGAQGIELEWVEADRVEADRIEAESVETASSDAVQGSQDFTLEWDLSEEVTSDASTDASADFSADSEAPSLSSAAPDLTEVARDAELSQAQPEAPNEPESQEAEDTAEAQEPREAVAFAALASLELPDLELDAPALAHEPEPVASSSEVKHIGALRISIPLYNVYLNEADEWSRVLLNELSEWSLELQRPVPEAAISSAHSLAGSSATVGFTDLSALARAVEHALQRLHGQSAGTPQQAQVLVDASEEIRRLLHQFAAGILKEPLTSVLDAVQNLEPVDSDGQAPPSDSDFGTLGQPNTTAFKEAQGTIEEGVWRAAEKPVPAVPLPSPVTIDDAPVHAIADLIDVVDTVDEDLLPIFLEEAEELLPQMSTALRRWISHPDDLDARAQVLRGLHTLKGSSRLAGAMRLGEMAHRTESAIELLGTGTLASADLEPMLDHLDELQSGLQRLQSWEASAALAALATKPEPAAAPESPVAEIAPEKLVVPRGHVALPAELSLVNSRAAASQMVRVRSQLLDRLVTEAGEVITSRTRLESEIKQVRGLLTDLTGNMERLRVQLRDVELQAETQMQSRLALSRDAQQNFDPLEFDRFTRMQELTRMMAESVNDIGTVQRSLQLTVEASEDNLAAQARLSRELQRDLLRTRMVEFEAISERLYRTVRQASKETGKRVRLEITGGSIEMDRGILERMASAFEHLLRNCVVHGIERAELRAERGKSAEGLVSIVVQQAGNDVSVEFRDDGGGFDLDRIRARAIEVGLVTSDQPLTEAESADLIFGAGFSTASQVTELAGRGIGLDVVRSEIQALGGRIETTSQKGAGSSFKLVMPLTTAVTHVVMLRAGSLVVGVPSNLVEIVQRASVNALQQAYDAGEHVHGDKTLPFFWLGALLQNSRRGTPSPDKQASVVILRSAEQRIALHVDEVLNNQEVVVKNLGPQLSRLPGLVAITALASGSVVLIYNPVALATVYGDQARALTASTEEAVAAGGGLDVSADRDRREEAPLVLVVDDSITVRRVTQRMLLREGYRVALAADGLQGLERLQIERPSVVLSDIEMPRMDGFDFVRNIRADEQLRDLPIIMITSRIAEKHREHARELGVNHYLGKPYSEEELLRLVGSYARSAAGETSQPA
ncbi:Hpt domain-containing protein [Ottowia thiooxydans]|uniref:histidine kinase n=1 Tax=Ottowia thiooxydans TaxID=219182 RepID=A0ABV2QDY9_9BURK